MINTELQIITFKTTAKSTLSKLGINGLFECFTLELPIVDGKPGSAIPPLAGETPMRFPVRLRPSPKFLAVAEDPARDPVYRDFVRQYAGAMPHIDEISGRSLIMFHWGHDERDTEGCVIVGQKWIPDALELSRSAFANFYPKISKPAQDGNCYVTVMR